MYMYMYVYACMHMHMSPANEARRAADVHTMAYMHQGSLYMHPKAADVQAEHLYMHTYTCIPIYTYIHACMRTHVYAYIYVEVEHPPLLYAVHLYMHAYPYVRIHIHAGSAPTSPLCGARGGRV